MLDILVVEDNREIGKILADFLRKEHYVVSVAETGEKALELFERYGAKLVILDLMLPGIDGFAVCSRIRESSNAHILIASAKTQKEDKLKGLNLGADDYIDKPYDMDILLAKIHGIFKRKYAMEEIICEDLKLNTVAQTVYLRRGERNKEEKHGTADGGQMQEKEQTDWKLVETTAKEFELLRLLVENRGVTLSKEYLFRTIWGSDSESEMQTLTVHIKWLRQKLEQDPKYPVHIITEWGTGYRFE